MNIETIKAIQEALAPIADKIGQGAEFGWEVVLQQQIVEAWLAVFWAFVSVVAFVIGCLVQKKAWEGCEDFIDTNPFTVLPSFVMIILAVIGFVSSVSTAITHFLNPSYYALEFFIHLAK